MNKAVSYSLFASLAAVSAWMVAGCGPPPATRDNTFGVWQGTQQPSGKKIQVTFIAPDKVEIEFPDEKGRKKEDAKWELAEGKVKVTRKSGSWMLKLDTPTVDDEVQQRLTAIDGSVVIVKL